MARNRRIPRLDMAARISVAGAVAFTLVTVSTVLGWTQHADEVFLRWAATITGEGVAVVLSEITTLGDGIVVGAVALVAAVSAYLAGRGRRAAFLLVVAFGALLLGPALKALIGRPRPELLERATTARFTSYPSSHALHAMALWGGVAYALARRSAPFWLRVFLWTAAVILIAGIGISRVVLGVHYPTDVIAGWAAGATWLGFCLIWLGPDARRRR